MFSTLDIEPRGLSSIPGQPKLYNERLPQNNNKSFGLRIQHNGGDLSSMYKALGSSQRTHTKSTLIYLAISLDMDPSHMTLGLLRSYQSKALLYKPKEACVVLAVLAQRWHTCSKTTGRAKSSKGGPGPGQPRRLTIQYVTCIEGLLLLLQDTQIEGSSVSHFVVIVHHTPVPGIQGCQRDPKGLNGDGGEM